jgi:phosphopantothenoylcysteine decarboxylase/phosphopantothenate--cysteine ligase
LATKEILITTGPTWVALDAVRVITNRASGKTGIILAKQLIKKGFKVTLLLGPVTDSQIEVPSAVKVIRFQFFEELENTLLGMLKRKRYHAVIHSAAVSDYKPAKITPFKIPSGKKSLSLKLYPTNKIVNKIKKISPQTILTAFKFEPMIKDARLLKEAKSLMRKSQANIVIANTTRHEKYRAFVLSENKISKAFSSKKTLSRELARIIAQKIHD